MNGRATTPEQKRAVIERIYAAWCKVPGLRLGQVLTDAANRSSDIHFLKDKPLAEAVERFVASDRCPACGQVLWRRNEDFWCRPCDLWLAKNEERFVRLGTPDL